MRRPGRWVGCGRLRRGTDGPSRRPRRHMVEKEPEFGGTTAYSAGVVWIPFNSHQRAAGIRDSRERALAYLTHHVGNRLDRAKAEAYVDNAHAMLDLFESKAFVAYT